MSKKKMILFVVLGLVLFLVLVCAVGYTGYRLIRYNLIDTGSEEMTKAPLDASEAEQESTAPLESQKLTAEEEKILSYINDYYFFDTRWQYDEENKLSYDIAFQSFAIYGFWDDDGDYREELKQYATGNLYSAPFKVPAKIVDDFVTAKFDVAVDRSKIQEYDETSDSYLILPTVMDGHDYAELISYEHTDNVYTVVVNQRNWLDPELVEKQTFRLKIEGENCKYLAFSKN